MTAMDPCRCLESERQLSHRQLRWLNKARPFITAGSREWSLSLRSRKWRTRWSWLQPHKHYEIRHAGWVELPGLGAGNPQK